MVVAEAEEVLVSYPFFVKLRRLLVDSILKLVAMMYAACLQNVASSSEIDNNIQKW